MNLLLLSGTFSICRLAADAPVPEWAATGEFVSITRTPDELSIVCAQNTVPENVQTEPGWRALKVQGVQDFALTGVLADLANPLAESGISIFAISTFDTDYVLVKEVDLQRASQSLEKAGVQVIAVK